MQIEFSADEIKALQQLLHIAVQARGLEVAEAGLHFARKLTAKPAEAVDAQ